MKAGGYFLLHRSVKLKESTVGNNATRRGRLYLIVGSIAFLILLLLTGRTNPAGSRPSTSAGEQPQIAGALRPGSPDFEWHRQLIVVAQTQIADMPRSDGGSLTELTALVRNGTGRAIQGLEMYGAVVDLWGAVVGERTVMPVPAQQTALEPDEVMRVRIIFQDVEPEAGQLSARLEVKAVLFE